MTGGVEPGAAFSLYPSCLFPPPPPPSLLPLSLPLTLSRLHSSSLSLSLFLSLSLPLSLRSVFSFLPVLPPPLLSSFPGKFPLGTKQSFLASRERPGQHQQRATQTSSVRVAPAATDSKAAAGQLPARAPAAGRGPGTDLPVVTVTVTAAETRVAARSPGRFSESS